MATSLILALVAIGKPREAQRAAIAHLLFNTLAVVIWLPPAARTVSRVKSRIKVLGRAALDNQNLRLLVDEPNRDATYRFEMDLIANLKRIYFHQEDRFGIGSA